MKMKRKKSIGVMLLVSFLVLYVVSIKSSASQQQIYVGDFNLYEYRADLYLDENTVCGRSIQNMMKMETFPSKVITDQLNAKSMFQNSVSAWKAAHFAQSPSQIAEGGIDEKGYYTAIILSIFKSQVNNKNAVFDITKKVESDTNKMLSNMKKWVKEADQIELDSISKNQIISTIPVQQQKLIQQYLTKEFKKNHPVLNNSSTLASDVATVFDAVKTLGEAVELMESYIRLTEISGSMKSVLAEMYRRCPDDNPAMKAALQEAMLASEDLCGAIDATISNTAGKETAQVVGVLLDEGWDALIKANPYARVFMAGANVGTWLGETVCTTLFSTNKTIEQYEKMKCLDEFTVLLRDTVTDMGNTYLNSKSTQNAENYFAAIEALFSAGDLSCDFASNYADILYKDSGLGWLTMHKGTYQEYMNSVQSIKKHYQNEEQILVTNYLAQLQGEHPDIYEILMGLDEEDPVPVTGIAFDYEEVVVGLKEPLFLSVKKPVITPENASNQKVTYTSSDPTILKVNDQNGRYDPVRPGTVTVTATSEDGGFTDTIRVRVVEGASGNWDAVVGPAVDSYGMCGENVEWVLYENGNLVISGEGEMEDFCIRYEEEGPWDNLKVKDVVVENGVSSIGNYAFRKCSSLTGIELPAGLSSIGSAAFSGCSSLMGIELPAGVSSIGSAAFSGCSSLTSIELPAGLSSIGSDAFSECSSLTSIELPAGVSSIGDYAFWMCSGLTSIKLSAEVSSIGSSVFSGCSSLTSIELPAGVSSIGYGTFSGCSSLTSIELPAGVSSIGDDAFSWCSSLTSINLPAGVSNIGNYAFYACPKLIIYGKENSYAQTYASEHNIPFKPLEDWPQLSQKNLSACQITISAEKYIYDGGKKELNVTVTDNGRTLTKDTDYTVSYQNNINAGTASVIVVGKGGYTGTVTKTYIIAACDISKAKISLSQSRYTYDGKTKKPAPTVTLNKRKLKVNTDYVVKYANNTKVGTATVTITGKGNYTGTAKTTFTIQSVSKSKKSISKATVTLKKSSYAYDGKTKKPAVTVKLGKTTLKANRDYKISYKNNKNIGKATVTITGTGNYTGRAVKTFQIVARKGTTFTVSGNKYKITGSAQVSFTGVKNAKATKAVIPATVKIGGKTFKVTSIASSALKNKTKITNVTIGSNITSIGSNAFYGCKKLGVITIKSAKLKTVGKNAFKGIKATAKIKVPKAKEKSYKKLLKGKGQGKNVKVVRA